MKHTFLIPVLLFALSSCSSNKEEPGNTPELPVSGVEQQNIALPSAASDNPDQPAGEAVTPVNSQVTIPAADGPLNPAHGEPGHRCEIPVGAPLSSAPAPGTGDPVNQIPVPASPAPSSVIQTQPAVTAPGMNPPHGEPGHDCSIPVGSPLNK